MSTEEFENIRVACFKDLKSSKLPLLGAVLNPAPSGDDGLNWVAFHRRNLRRSAVLRTASSKPNTPPDGPVTNYWA